MKRKITLCILLILIIMCVTLLSYEKINKENINNDNTGMFAIFLEEEKDSGKYQKSNLKTWPTEEEYTINMLKSYCENGSILRWNSKTKKISLKVNGTDKCYVYFDKAEIGTEKHPHLIQTIEDLVRLSNNVNNGTTYAGEYFLLTNDLDFNDPSDYENADSLDFEDINGINNAESLIKELTTGSGFIPIGNSEENSFQGIFDGGNKKIDNLYIDNSTLDRIGLFGMVNNSTIKNLIIEGDFHSNINTTMGMIGTAMGTTTIKNCQNKINMTSSVGTDSIGGFIGENNANLTIINSQNYGNLTNGSKVGGLIGISKAPTNIENCSNKGNIIVNNKLFDNNLGGLIGLTNDVVNIKNSFNDGKIEDNINYIYEEDEEYSYAGGLIGNINIQNLSKIVTISSSYNSQNGTIKGMQVGGLIGIIIQNSKAIIDKSYNLGNVMVVNKIMSLASRAGGFVGYNCVGGRLYILNSYNLGNITNEFDISDSSSYHTGGFLGSTWASYAWIINSYNQGNLSSLGSVGNIVAYSSYEKKLSFNASMLINNVYAVGELYGPNKYTIGNLQNGDYTINNFYHLPEFSSSHGSIIKTIDEMKSQTFVDELNQNVESINLEQIDSILKDYKLSKWELGKEGYPTLINE